MRPCQPTALNYFDKFVLALSVHCSPDILRGRFLLTTLTFRIVAGFTISVWSWCNKRNGTSFVMSSMWKKVGPLTYPTDRRIPSTRYVLLYGEKIFLFVLFNRSIIKKKIKLRLRSELHVTTLHLRNLI